MVDSMKLSQNEAVQHYHQRFMAAKMQRPTVASRCLGKAKRTVSTATARRLAQKLCERTSRPSRTSILKHSISTNARMAQSRLAGRLGLVPRGLANSSCLHLHQSSSLLAQRRLLCPHQPSSHLHTVVSEGSLPRVAQPSLWVSLIPKFLRQKTPKDPAKPAKPRSKEWNPATFYIVIFLLIGSQAIQMIALKKEFANFSRRADARIGLLKEAIERVQRGEDVDVKALLGTGDQAAEKEWEEVMHELTQENTLRQDKKNKPTAQQQQPNKDPAPANTSTETQPPQVPESRSQSTASTGRAPRGFY